MLVCFYQFAKSADNIFQKKNFLKFCASEEGWSSCDEDLNKTCAETYRKAKEDGSMGSIIPRVSTIAIAVIAFSNNFNF